MGATLVVALFLALASVAFVLLQRQQLTSSLIDLAQQRSDDVAGEVRTKAAGVDLDGNLQSLVQVMDARGDVVGASSTIAGEPALTALRPAPGKVVSTTSSRLPAGDRGPYAVVARGTSSPNGPMVVVAAQSLSAVERSTAVTAGLLAVGYPLVLLAVALSSYWLTGRALAPVEAIRRRVASIGGTTELSARVPVPDTADEISRLAETMNSMLARVQRGVQAQRRFIGDASHELRSPLAMIRASHEIEAMHPGATDWPVVTFEILAELDRLDRLVSDMLLLARADEHALVVHRDEVDLDDLVADEGARLHRLGVRDVLVSAPPTRVLGDRHLLERALRNICDNAARHAGRRVELRLGRRGGTATIDVLDDGPGIAPEDVDRIFERFVRLDPSRTRHSGGTGLGLPISRQIARAHGGDLIASAGAGGGHLSLRLPIARRGSGDAPNLVVA
jgi:signal transduction histidine kinase